MTVPLLSSFKEKYRERASRVLATYASDLEAYAALLARCVRPGDRLLHIGCGWDRSRVAAPYLSSCEVIGVDLDIASGVRYPSQYWHADASNLPFGDATFDVAFCEYVLEHVRLPEDLFREVSRVLRPGGHFVFLTPSRWSYKSVVAAATPTSFHRLVAARLRPDKREGGDVFPTLYRANSVGRITSQAESAGLRVVEIECASNGPTWFRSMPVVFDVAHRYHRLIDKFDALAPLRCSLRGRLDKIGAPTSRSAELTLRCTQCGKSPMSGASGAPICAACGKRYVDQDGWIDAYPE